MQFETACGPSRRYANSVETACRDGAPKSKFNERAEIDREHGAQHQFGRDFFRNERAYGGRHILLTLGCVIVDQISWCEDALILLPPGSRLLAARIRIEDFLVIRRERFFESLRLAGEIDTQLRGKRKNVAARVAVPLGERIRQLLEAQLKFRKGRLPAIAGQRNSSIERVFKQFLNVRGKRSFIPRSPLGIR
jgi:hypothetical protein